MAILAAAALAWAPSATSAPKEPLILHDSGGSYGHIGPEHAVMLENLLGHFDLKMKTEPVTSTYARRRSTTTPPHARRRPIRSS